MNVDLANATRTTAATDATITVAQRVRSAGAGRARGARELAQVLLPHVHAEAHARALGTVASQAKNARRGTHVLRWSPLDTEG